MNRLFCTEERNDCYHSSQLLILRREVDQSGVWKVVAHFPTLFSFCGVFRPPFFVCRRRSDGLRYCFRLRQTTGCDPICNIDRHAPADHLCSAFVQRLPASTGTRPAFAWLLHCLFGCLTLCRLLHFTAPAGKSPEFFEAPCLSVLIEDSRLPVVAGLPDCSALPNQGRFKATHPIQLVFLFSRYWLLATKGIVSKSFDFANTISRILTSFIQVAFQAAVCGVFSSADSLRDMPFGLLLSLLKPPPALRLPAPQRPRDPARTVPLSMVLACLLVAPDRCPADSSPYRELQVSFSASRP